MDRAVDPALPFYRRVLAAGGVDADPHAQPRGGGGEIERSPAAGISPPVPLVVRLRLSRLRRSDADLLADDRQADVCSMRAQSAQASCSTAQAWKTRAHDLYSGSGASRDRPRSETRTCADKTCRPALP